MYDKKLPSKCKPIHEWTKDEFVAEIASQFVYSESTARIIYNALLFKKHCLFWGPGGHAKSQVVEFALRMIMDKMHYDTDTFITACGGKMRTEQFQGFQSLPAFKEGRDEMIMDQTMFVKAKYAVLDELLAAPSQLLLFLRDGISRGELCVNGVCHKVITQSIFACTNIDPDTWATAGGDADEERSRKALLQRFLFRKKVCWPAYEADNFSHMFINAGGDEAVWAEICAETVKILPDFSPRTAMAGLELYRSSQGIDALEGFDGITDNVFEMWKKIELAKAYIGEANRLAHASLELEEMLNLPTLTGQQARVINAKANSLLGQWGKLHPPKDARLYESIGTTKKRLTEISSRSYTKGFEEEEQAATITW